MRGVLVRVGFALLALLVAGCDWGTFHGGPGRDGFQAGESSIGTGTVGQLTLARSYSGATTEPLVVGGTLYSLTGNGILQAFDAKGVDGCTGTPVVCTPLWTSKGIVGLSITVANGRVYASGLSSAVSGPGLQVFDAAGVSGCDGSPKTCAPIWTSGTFKQTGPGSPAVVGGVVYVTGVRSNSFYSPAGQALVIAYDASGSTNCTANVCSPLWYSTAAPTDVSYSQALAVSNDTVYSVEGSRVAAFDAKGTNGCGGSPKVCSPLWTATAPTSLSYGGPAVSNGTLYVAGYGANLYAYDAAGGTGCSGSPKTCNPLWRASVGDTRNTPAIANGTVYVVSGSGVLRAFDANGSINCTGTTKVCTPLWTYDGSSSGYGVSGSPAVANGLVYTVTPDSYFRAIDAAGSINCMGSPKACLPLRSATTGKIATSASPAIVAGTVYWNSATVHTTWAYTL